MYISLTVCDIFDTKAFFSMEQWWKIYSTSDLADMIIPDFH